jgi:anthranilate synthase component II
MILLIDNYDSFVYILKQYFEQCGHEVEVIRNDKISVDEAVAKNPDYLVISPGPSTPKKAGVSMELIRAFKGQCPILGVCLGHQSIAEVFGGTIIRNHVVMHGKRSAIHHNNEGLFSEIPNPFLATRYHSLVVEPESFPHDELIITAKTDAGEIMGLRHKAYPIHGVQFHPESYLTEEGMRLIQNFLTLVPQNSSDVEHK